MSLTTLLLVTFLLSFASQTVRIPARNSRRTK